MINMKKKGFFRSGNKGKNLICIFVYIYYYCYLLFNIFYLLLLNKK